jgi:hypothetical protein
MLGGVVLVLCVAASLYGTYPWRVVRRNRFVPIGATAPEIASTLDELRRETDLAIAPQFVWNPLTAARTGLAFGRLGRYQVALTGGLVTQLVTDRPAFRAVVFHELAHLRNGDIDRTYFSLALWEAFLVAGVLPFGLSQLFSGRPPTHVLDSAWRILPLAALVYLTRNAVLRTRETYADVRASTWDGPHGALRRTLEALPRPSHTWWRRLFDNRVHPDPQVRRRAVDDTRPLFRLHLTDAFATGVSAGIALPNVVLLFELLVPMPVAIVRPVAAALVCAPLAVWIVGLGAWRATFASLVQGQRIRGAARAGVALAVGLVLGHELSLGAVEFGRGLGPLGGLPVVALNIVWLAVLALFLAGFFRWMLAGAAAWLEVAVDDPGPGHAYRTGLTVAGVLLAAWLGVLLFGYLAARTGGNAVALSDLEQAGQVEQVETAIGSEAVAAGAAAALTGIEVLALVSLLVVCAYPLAAWLWRSRPGPLRMAAWAFLDAHRSQAVDAPAPLEPVTAVRAGVIGGVAYCALNLAVYGWLFVTRESQSQWAEAAGAWTQVGAIAFAVLMQVVVALAVAFRVRRLVTVHALCGGMIAGWLMALGALLLLWGFGLLWDDWGLTLLFISTVVLGGAVISGPLALVVSGVRESP